MHIIFLSLGGEQPDPERDDAQGERRYAQVEQPNEAVRPGDAFPCRGEEEPGRHEDGRSPDAVAREEGEQTAHRRGSGPPGLGSPAPRHGRARPGRTPAETAW